MRLLVAVVAACVAGILSCTSSPVSGGSGTETINTYVCFAESGQPARGASVAIIDADGWIDSIQKNVSPVIARTVTDTNGYFTLDITGKRALNVQIDHQEQGTFVSGIYSLSYFDYPIKLKKYGSYKTAFKEKQHHISHLRLSGTDYISSIGDDGDFYFEKVSSGLFSVIGSNGDGTIANNLTMCGAVSLESEESKIDSSLNPLPDRLLLDNFEGKFGLTIPGLVYPEIYWYAVSDFGIWYWSNPFNVWKKDAHEYPLGKSYVSIEPEEESGNTALNFTAVLDSKSIYSYTIAGISFRGFSSKHYADLSGMKSFSMKAKGEGTIWVRFETRELKDETSSISHYTYPIKLNDTLTQYTVPVDSLQILPGKLSTDSYPWSRVASKVLQIEFEFYPSENTPGESMKLILDDFYLDGVNLDKFYK
ncbi:MAG: hypothetical protein Q4F84_04630 [Fibrobacter sp.]|nr:hypothetical protein [Fibrobacter sp.]